MRKLPIHTRILLALVAGMMFGFAANRLGFAPFVISYVKPVGTAFIKLISMVVVPLVFASLLVGTTSLKDIRSLGRIGIKTIGYYMLTTAVAISVGLAVANIWQPGSGLSQQTKQSLIESAAAKKDFVAGITADRPSIMDMLLNIIPTNPIRSFAEANILQIIFFALLCGICLMLIPPERSRPVISFFEAINDMIVKMVHVIMQIAPYGVFALIAAVVADFGFGILVMLIKYSGVVLLGLLIFSRVEAGRVCSFVY